MIAVLFAVCAPGIEPVLLLEVEALGLRGRAVAGGVEVDAPLAEVARLNLWLRTASRVLVRMGTVEATKFPELVRKAAALPWERFVGKGAAVALRVTCRKSRLYHSGAVAERLHAALEQRLGGKVELRKAAAEDEPPSGTALGDSSLGQFLGTAHAPQLFVARFDHDVLTVSADSSGALLHQRGWRGPSAKAPLRETLAAALLLAARWDPATPLCDPLCGAGTIPIEGALLAMRRAPGLSRAFAFEEWPGFDLRPFQELREKSRKSECLPPARVEASDLDAGAVAATRGNAARAGVALEVAQRPLSSLPPDAGAGLIACNPPWGVRIERGFRFDELAEARRRRPRWRLAAVLGDARAASALRWRRLLKTQAGGIPVEFAECQTALIE